MPGFKIQCQAGMGFPLFDGTNKWVTNFFGNTVTELVASTGAVVGTCAVGSGPVGIVFDGVNIWVANTNSNNVSNWNACGMCRVFLRASALDAYCLVRSVNQGLQIKPFPHEKVTPGFASAKNRPYRLLVPI
jgi:DNA-binding beta-propeller fold protein YncE